MRKMIYVIYVMCVMCVAGFGQTAKVIALSKEDATRAKQIHEELDRAQKALDNFQGEIEQRYLLDKAPLEAAGAHVVGAAGVLRDEAWRGGFEYSDDWLYIVPKREPPFTITGSGTLTGTTICWPSNVAPSIANPGWQLNAVPMIGSITGQ